MLHTVEDFSEIPRRFGRGDPSCHARSVSDTQIVGRGLTTRADRFSLNKPNEGFQLSALASEAARRH